MGGRLNPVGEPVIYLGSTPTLAVAENLRLASLFGVARFPPRLLVTIEVTLARVADLRCETPGPIEGLAATDLRSDWRASSTSTPSQHLGRRLMQKGYEGAIYPSVLEPDSTNLAIFVRNVEPERALRVIRND